MYDDFYAAVHNTLLVYLCLVYVSLLIKDTLFY